MLPGFREIKHHYNKPTETYGCEIVQWAEWRVILKYVSEEGRTHPKIGIEFPAGTVTIATYWKERGYVVWQMYHPEGKLLGYYVHIVENLMIARDAVEYRDALVDVWFWPNGNHQVLDEDEMYECMQRGQLDRERELYIQQQKAHVLMTWERIVEQLPEDAP